MLIVEFDRPSSWSLDASETGESIYISNLMEKYRTVNSLVHVMPLTSLEAVNSCLILTKRSQQLESVSRFQLTNHLCQ